MRERIDFRKNHKKNEQHASYKWHASFLYMAFSEGLEDDFPQTLEKRVRAMFKLWNTDTISLTQKEIVDVDNFAKYATKRIAAGALSSPLSKDLMGQGKTDDALKEMAPVDTVIHDLLHAMWAWQRTNGRSLIPAYMRVENQALLFTDPIAVEEELAVGLMDNMFIRYLLKSKDPKLAFKIYSRLDNKSKQQEIFYETVKQLEDLKEKDPREYYFRIYEAYEISIDGDVHPEFAEAVHKIQERRGPAYTALFNATYDNAHQEKPDQKFSLHEFQRMLAPLLARLRKKEKTA